MRFVLIVLIALTGCTASITPIHSNNDELLKAVVNHEQVIKQIVEALNPILKERNAKVKETKNDK